MMGKTRNIQLPEEKDMFLILAHKAFFQVEIANPTPKYFHDLRYVVCRLQFAPVAIPLGQQKSELLYPKAEPLFSAVCSYSLQTGRASGRDCNECRSPLTSPRRSAAEDRRPPPVLCDGRRAAAACARPI